ncbi:MAG: hypothetical protein PHS53_02375 [Candidatus Pacebacteria bacterium]|nr:hypothetical protein [Candidatus Paceibacterota bacterium]
MKNKRMMRSLIFQTFIVVVAKKSDMLLHIWNEVLPTSHKEELEVRRSEIAEKRFGKEWELFVITKILTLVRSYGEEFEFWMVLHRAIQQTHGKARGEHLRLLGKVAEIIAQYRLGNIDAEKVSVFSKFQNPWAPIEGPRVLNPWDEDLLIQSVLEILVAILHQKIRAEHLQRFLGRKDPFPQVYRRPILKKRFARSH